MRKAAFLLILFAACEHQSGTPAPSAPLRAESLATSAPALTASAAKPGAPKSAPVRPALSAPGPRAYVIDATGLVEVAAPGGSQVVVSGALDWCSADARAKVVWFRRGGDLFAFV